MSQCSLLFIYLALWLCLKICSENVTVVRLPQKGAQKLTVNYKREKNITIYHNINGATPPIGKIHPFSKMAVTFEPVM